MDARSQLNAWSCSLILLLSGFVWQVGLSCLKTPMCYDDEQKNMDCPVCSQVRHLHTHEPHTQTPQPAVVQMQAERGPLLLLLADRTRRLGY